MIGDRAMRVPGEPFHDLIDLGEAWHTLTGLPFVFALWVARECLGDTAQWPYTSSLHDALIA